MSEIEDKILGRTLKTKAAENLKKYFTSESVWTVTRKGCGTCLMNGKMVFEMLSSEGKRKASKGTKRIMDNGAEFIRK